MTPALVMFALLATLVGVGRYQLGLGDRPALAWRLVAVTLALLTWLLPLMAHLRSR